MTPADHGYAQCVRCGAWRRTAIGHLAATPDGPKCIAWDGCVPKSTFIAHAGSPVLFMDGVDVNATSAPTGLDANGDAR